LSNAAGADMDFAEKQGGTMRKFLALAVIILTASPAAADLSIDDLVGRWCGDTSQYKFTRTQLNVTLLNGKKPKHGPVLEILRVDVKADKIELSWKPDRRGNSTAFKLSTDKQQLIQQSESEGDKGPKRIFKRC
jgi:hypothetical protein